MYKVLRVAMVIPAYNEAKLITKTVDSVPEYIDNIIVVNDGSTDNTLEVLEQLAHKDKRLIVIDNDRNHGVGYTVVNGFKHALQTNNDVIGVMAGDAQCDTNYLSVMLDKLIESHADYVKANRFVHLEQLAKMPTYRKIGNIFITILTKFATGYYSIFDTQNGYGVFRRQILETIRLDSIGERYDYENTLLVALAIAGAKVKDVPVPAIYGSEVSSIKFLPVAFRALKVLFFGFWRRMYYRYILYGLHPIALFFFSGLFIGFLGFVAGIIILFEKIFHHLSPSTGTVMLVVLPIIIGFQLFLSAITMDMENEGRD